MKNQIHQGDLAHCPFCEKMSQIWVVKGDRLCKSCGYLFENVKQWVFSQYEENLPHTLDPLVQGSSFTKRAYSSKKDYTGSFVKKSISSRLEKTYQRTKSSTSIDRARYRGLLQIDRVTKILELPSNLSKGISERFLDFNGRGILKNRNLYACILALTVIVANIQNIPVSISQVLKHTSLSRKKFNKEYFYLYYQFETPEPTSATPEKHLERFKSYIKPWKRQDQFNQTLETILKQIEFKNMQGRDAIVTAGTVLVHLLHYFEYPQTDKFLKKLVLNRLTIKNCWDSLILKSPNLKIYQKQNKT